MEGIDLEIPALLSNFREAGSTPLAVAQAVAKQTAGFDSTFLQLEPSAALETRCRCHRSALLDGQAAFIPSFQQSASMNVLLSMSGPSSYVCLELVSINPIFGCGGLAQARQIRLG